MITNIFVSTTESYLGERKRWTTSHSGLSAYGIVNLIVENYMFEIGAAVLSYGCQRTHVH